MSCRSSRAWPGRACPVKLYSILAAGRPIVASIDAGTEVARTVERAGAGLAVPPEDPEAFTKAVRRLLDAEADRDEMGASGRRFVERWASPAAVAEAYEQLFASVRVQTCVAAAASLSSRYGQGIFRKESRTRRESRRRQAVQRNDAWRSRLAIGGIVVVGILIIVVARSGFTSVSAESPKTGEHWHAAYGFYVCDTFLPPLADVTADTSGMHTHGDGIAHIHPFSNAYAGQEHHAGQLGSRPVGVELRRRTRGSCPTAPTYENGYDCNGQAGHRSPCTSGHADDPDAPSPRSSPRTSATSGSTTDRSAFTIAVVPEGTDVPEAATAFPRSTTSSDVGRSTYRDGTADASTPDRAACPPSTTVTDRATP